MCYLTVGCQWEESNNSLQVQSYSNLRLIHRVIVYWYLDQLINSIHCYLVHWYCNRQRQLALIYDPKMFNHINPHYHNTFKAPHALITPCFLSSSLKHFKWHPLQIMQPLSSNCFSSYLEIDHIISFSHLSG